MGAVVACEWSENCADLLEQEQPIHIHIDRVDETTRKITSGGFYRFYYITYR